MKLKQESLGEASTNLMIQYAARAASAEEAEAEIRKIVERQ